MEFLERAMFFNHEFDIYGTVEDPWFKATEIAGIIDYSSGKTNHMLELIPAKHKQQVWPTVKGSTKRGGNRRPIWMINEFGLYEVLYRSGKPVAVEFKEFVNETLHDMRLYSDPKSVIPWFAMIESNRLCKNLAPALDRENTWRRDHEDEELSMDELIELLYDNRIHTLTSVDAKREVESLKISYKRRFGNSYFNS